MLPAGFVVIGCILRVCGSIFRFLSRRENAPAVIYKPGKSSYTPIKKRVLFELKRTRIELIIPSFLLKQFRMVSAFNDSSAFDY